MYEDEERATVRMLVEAGLVPGADSSWPAHLKHLPHDREEQAVSDDRPTGDDRPTVYNEDGLWVFRASGVWRCDRELWAHMQETFTPEPTLDWLQEKFDAGNAGEDEILEAAGKALGVQVYDAQKQVTLEVGKKAIVRGHIDGRTETVLVEAKTMAEKTYMTTWLRQGLKGFPGYSAQVAVYAKAIGVKSVCMAIGVKDDAGKVKEVKTFSYDVEKLPVTVVDVKKKIMRVMRMDEMPVCSVDQYPCPFFYLHDEKPIMVSDSEMLAKYAEELFGARSEKKKVEERVKELTELFSKEIDTVGLEGKFVAGKYTVTDVVKTNLGRLDYAKMEEDGVELQKYRGKETTTRYQTVKMVEGEK